MGKNDTVVVVVVQKGKEIWEKTADGGSLGSCIDEERSQVR